MDTEGNLQIQQKIREGKSPNKKNAYYPHAWWESYKGSVKGKLGGMVIGAIVGLAVGGIVAGALSIAGVAAAATGVTLAAFAAAGMMYGAHEFSDIGKVVGSGAAQSEQLEERLKTIVKAESATIKEKINELEASIDGKHKPNFARDAAQNKEDIAEAIDQETNYRKTHYAKLKSEPINTFAFWKVALIGLAVGAAAGALLAMGPGGGAAAIIFEHIGLHLGESAIMATSIAAFGAMGASFGLNRDFFRKVFDKTDLWFDGIIHSKYHAQVRESQVKAGKEVIEEINEHSAVATAVIPDNSLDYPKSETHFRDKVLPAAQRALLSFDHTRATPQ